MNKLQVRQFNKMLEALRCIAGSTKGQTRFMTSDQLLRSKEVKAGFMEPDEILAMAYDNIQSMAKDACSTVKPIKEQISRNYFIKSECKSRNRLIGSSK